MSNVLITGGTGLVGKHLCHKLKDAGYHVAILSRTKKPGSAFKTYYWNPATNEIEKEALETADYIIHLAGENIGDKRWSAERKQLIIDSRVKSGLLLFDNFMKSEHRLKSFISASATGYYGSVNSEKTFTETDPPGTDFTAHVCREWESVAGKFEASGIRTVVVRTGVVLSKKGGALQKMITPVKMGVGSPLGNGKQYMPWIHMDDLCAIYMKAIEDSEMQGVYNAVAPEHITNKELTLSIARVLNKPFWNAGIPAFLLRLVFGEMAVILIRGSRVSSDKILNTGFAFQFPGIEAAMIDLVEGMR